MTPNKLRSNPATSIEKIDQAAQARRIYVLYVMNSSFVITASPKRFGVPVPSFILALLFSSPRYSKQRMAKEEMKPAVRVVYEGRIAMLSLEADQL